MDTRITEIIRLYASGLTYEAIGKKCGISKQRIHQILLKAQDRGLVRLTRHRRPALKPNDLKKIAQKLISGELALAGVVAVRLGHRSGSEARGHGDRGMGATP